MGYERYPRSDDRQDAGRGGSYGGQSRDSYSRDQGNDRYAPRGGGGGGYGGRDDADRGYGNRDAGRGGYEGDRSRYGQSTEYHGSYGSGGRRFEDVGRYAHADDDNYNDPDDRRGPGRPGPQQGQGDGDRGFFQRAGDEVRSWFGDEDAERRRDRDQREDERQYGDRAAAHRDHDYHNWRSGQIAALDRDYDEYRQEHRAKFENEFASWRTARQGQRDSLGRVEEHMEVLGADGAHVGTVDKVRGDRILLTKNDADAGGHHHSIPSRWVESVDGKVTLTKTAAEAKQQWRDEERNQAMFGDRSQDGRSQDGRSQGSGNAGQSSGQTGSAQASSSSTSGVRTY
jgi:hypothetical protein